MKKTKNGQYKLSHNEIKNMIRSVDYSITPNGILGYLFYPFVMIYVHIKFMGLYMKCKKIRVNVGFDGGDKG